MLFGLAFRYTRRREDADDLLQDTMLKAFAAWKRFEPGRIVGLGSRVS